MLADRDYMQLRPQERLRATVSAMARGDDAEQDRLIETCPSGHYKMPDADFSEPLKLLQTMATMHQLMSLRLMVGFLAANMAAKRAEERQAEDGIVAIDAMWETTIACLKGRQRAWEQFCAETGLDHVEVAAMLQIGLKDDKLLHTIEAAMMREDVELDAEVQDRYFGSLMATWEAMRQ